MTGSLFLALLWIVVASVAAVAMQRLRGGAVYVLILCGIPIVGWVTLQHGPWLGMGAVALGACLLRWPLVRLYHRYGRRRA